MFESSPNSNGVRGCLPFCGIRRRSPRLIGPFIFSPVRGPEYWSEVKWSEPWPGISVRSKIVRSVVRDFMVVILSIFGPSIRSVVFASDRRCSQVFAGSRRYSIAWRLLMFGGFRRCLMIFKLIKFLDSRCTVSIKVFQFR